LLVVGAGAAGHFAASELLRRKPESRILLLEKTGQVLSKVRISGGGRCNVTHHCFDNVRLLANYPRGNPWLKEAFRQFSVQDTLNWFKAVGVRIVAEPDGRMFPESNQSETIVRALCRWPENNKPEIRLHSQVIKILPLESGFRVFTKNSEPVSCRFLLLASGGSPGSGGMQYLSELQLKLVPPVPSLFTFNVKNHPWNSLMGLAAEDVVVSLSNSNNRFRGPVLVTHWGFSGPAVLRLSAAAARELSSANYQFDFMLDFVPDLSEAAVNEMLREQIMLNPRQKPLNARLFGLPARLWEQLCTESGLASYHNWAETGKKSLQQMAGLLKARKFCVSGKTTFKDEFVTAGGIALDQVNPSSCESIRYPGLFFAGEILDVDGFTGGFNFQAAWSTAYAAVKEISARLN